MEKLIFELIRVAISTQETLSRVPSAAEWKVLYEMAKKQSLVGICFAGVQRLGSPIESLEPRSIEPFELLQTHWNLPELLYLTWMGMAAKIQQRNEQMNQCTKDGLAHFREEGFACTCLKGQAIAALYRLHDNDNFASKDSINHKRSSINLTGLRQSGDVDVWVAGGRKKLYEHTMRMFGKIEGLTYHHIHYPLYDDPEVEAHVWPSFLTNPILNRRFQKFCSQYTPAFDNQDTPSLAFNRVFILQHCYGHFCGHGVGMRQLLDYYFVLKLGFTEEERTESMRWIEHLGMGRFAAALMWLCVEVFGMDKSLCISEPNEKYGRFLLAEVMMTGNMGHQDERVDHKKLQSALGRYLHNIERDWKTMRIAPGYALWEPFWGIFQFVWCRWTKYKYGK